MSISTERLLSREQNNFNLLRLLAALGVIITHSYALLGKPERDFLSIATHGLLSFSRLGVDVFFVISGFLVTNSLIHSTGTASFFWKRFLRIFPGLFVVLFLTVFVLGPLFTELPLASYFSHLGTYHYFFGGLSLYWTIYTLPGVFKHNLYPDAINGSLWTLPYEWTCYVLLAVLLPFFKKNRAVWLAGIIFCLLLLRGLVGRYGFFQVITPLHLDMRQLLEWASLFFLGSLALTMRNFLRLNWFVSVVFIIGLVLLPKIIVFYWMLVAIPYSTLWLAACPLPKKIAERLSGVDFSYGYYIYAFPIGQILAGMMKNTLSVPLLASLTMLCTLPFAVASWYFIEKPILRFKTQKTT